MKGAVSRAGGTPGWLLNFRSGTWTGKPTRTASLGRRSLARKPWCTHGLGHSMPAYLCSRRPGHTDLTARTRAPNMLTSHPPMPGTDSLTAAGPPPGFAHERPRTTAPEQPRAGWSNWTQATLVSDSFPRKRKPPPRVALPVGPTHQQVECRVNLQAGARVPPAGTPPGPYSAYT